MANILAMGDMWLRVPDTIAIELSGTLPKYISAKDIMLFILGKIGCRGAIGKVLEFRGSIIEHLSMDERMTLSNMAVECGAMCGLIVPDASPGDTKSNNLQPYCCAKFTISSYSLVA
ncbi:MAG: aconitase family protein [Pleurocapsa sp.]